MHKNKQFELDVSLLEDFDFPSIDPFDLSDKKRKQIGFSINSGDSDLLQSILLGDPNPMYSPDRLFDNKKFTEEDQKF